MYRTDGIFPLSSQGSTQLGDLAQWLEQHPYKVKVLSSSLRVATNQWGCISAGLYPDIKGVTGVCGFESCHPHRNETYGSVAELADAPVSRTGPERGVGSSPT